MNDIKNKLIHIQVFVAGKCKGCYTTNKILVYDHGLIPYGELDRKLEDINYPIPKINCSSCETEYSPDDMIIYDVVNQVEIVKYQIGYGNGIDERIHLERQQGNKRRFEIFKENEQEFWSKYTEFALQNWRDVINELLKKEIQEAYMEMGVEEQFKTESQYRRDVLNRFKTDKEKMRFWKEANSYFIYGYLLDIGPLSWQVKEDQKTFGNQRVRFIVLHFPMDEALEPVRTLYIGNVVKKEKGDNAFLFRRIGQITEQLTRTQKKNTELFHLVESLKLEIADYQKKLHQSYQDLRNEREDKHITHRDPKDIAKIRSYKSLINKLLEQIKLQDEILQGKATDAESNNTTLLEEEDSPSEDIEIIDLSILEGKIIGIIGGSRKEHASREYPCKLLTHEGRRLDPDFYSIIKEAEILVILTKFVSHAAMWEAKYHAIDEGKLICFEKAINIDRILQNICLEI